MMKSAVCARLAAATLAVLATAVSSGMAGYVETLTGMSGLISYWNLNETGGSTAADAVKNDLVDGDNPGTYSGSGITVGGAGPQPAGGFPGFAADNHAPVFSNKLSDILQMAHHSGYTGRTDLTLLGWMRFNESNQGVDIHFGGLERLTPENRYVFAAHFDGRYSDLRARVRQTDGTTEYGIMSRLFIPNDMDWHFFVMTYELGTTLRIYLDGWQRDADSSANALGLVAADGLVFGHDIDFAAAPTRGLYGQLDELASFDRAITPREVKQLWDAATMPELGKTATAPYRQTIEKLAGLRNYWQLDETSGPTALDAVGGNHGTHVPTSGFAANLGRPGPTPSDGFVGMPADNKSVQFVWPDGVNHVESQDGRVVGAPGMGLSFASGVKELTMALWFKSNYDGEGYVAGFERIGLDDRYIFAAYSPTGTDMRFYATTFNGERLVTGDIRVDLPDDYVWHHVAQVWDGDERRLSVYIDGREAYNQTNLLMSEFLAVPDGFYIGRDHWGDTRNLGGFVDEVSLFDRALSAEEAFELYDSAFFATAVIPGDANRDGKVDDQDASILAAHWQKSSGAAWGEGDFNGDGKVNDLDASILAANWQSGAGAAVPEPATLALLAAGALALLWLRQHSGGG